MGAQLLEFLAFLEVIRVVPVPVGCTLSVMGRRSLGGALMLPLAMFGASGFTHCAYVGGSDAIGSGECRVVSAFSVLSIFLSLKHYPNNLYTSHYKL